jgi:hypothetical protein
VQSCWDGSARERIDAEAGICRSGLSPTLEGAEDGRSGGDLDDLTRDKGSDGEGPRREDSEMEEVGEPTGAKEEDGKGCAGGGDKSAPEASGPGLHNADEPTGCCRGERIGEEETAVGTEQVGYASRSVRSKDRESEHTFDEVEDHCGKAGDGSEGQANEDDREVLQRERDGREGKRNGDVSAGGDERSGSDSEKGLAGEGLQERSRALGGAEVGGDGRLHRADSFRARSALAKWMEAFEYSARQGRSLQTHSRTSSPECLRGSVAEGFDGRASSDLRRLRRDVEQNRVREKSVFGGHEDAGRWRRAQS